MQYDWAREFPDYEICSANNLSIALLISNSHGPSMYTLSMVMKIGRETDDQSELEFIIQIYNLHRVHAASLLPFQSTQGGG